MDPLQSWLDAKEVRRMAESLMTAPPEVDPQILDAGYGDKFEGFADASQGGESVTQQPPSAGPDSAPMYQGERAQAQMESQLAKARDLAQGSGMLRDRLDKLPDEEPQHAQQSQPQQVVTPPPFSNDSPFQVSDHQDLTEDVPMAQQVDAEPVEEPQASPPKPVSVQPTQSLAPKPPSGFSRGVYQRTASSGARGPFLERLEIFSESTRDDFGGQALFLIDNDGQVIMDEIGNPKLIQIARTLANASYTASRQSAGAAAVGNLHVKIGANATLEVLPVQSRYGLLILGVIFPAPLGAERVTQLTARLESAIDPNKSSRSE